MESFKDIAFPYLDSIACASVKGHTQTVIWETAYKRQLKIEEELGKNFTPKLMAFLLAPSTLDEIERMNKIEKARGKMTPENILENIEGALKSASWCRGSQSH